MTALLPRRTATARTRLNVAVLLGVVAFTALPSPWELRLLGGWSVAALSFAAWALWTMLPADEGETRHLATREDPSRTFTGLILLLCAAVSFVAVGFALVRADKVGDDLRNVLIALGALSVALAWSVTHIVYGLHYAHLYYNDPQGGVDFPGTQAPCYRDFLYLAFTVGMTYQVSDTDVTDSKLRFSLLGHALLSFVFGTVIVAFTINVVAGLLK